ncbi:hypothetical protein F8251_06530, partial [Lactobacillus crispatus]
MIECSESILTSVDVFVVINILSNRSKWTFYFLQSVQVNFTIGSHNLVLILARFAWDCASSF